MINRPVDGRCSVSPHQHQQQRGICFPLTHRKKAKVNMFRTKYEGHTLITEIFEGKLSGLYSSQ
jgi:hypothetical protein